MLKVAITSIHSAFKEIKHFYPDEWEGDYRPYAREALKRIIEDRMERYRDAYLEELHRQDIVDRCNGYYPRHLLTELGDIELSIPRTRTFSAINILNLFARRTVNVDCMILLSFVLGLSTRKVGEALLPVLGEVISPQTVSRIAKQLDDAVISYHKRPLSDLYKALILDGVVMKQKTGGGAQKRIILVALVLEMTTGRRLLIFVRCRVSLRRLGRDFLTIYIIVG